MVTWVRATVAAASAAVPPCLSASSPAWIAIGERVAAISADCPSMTLACEGNGLFSSYGHRNLPWKDNCKSQARRDDRRMASHDRRNNFFELVVVICVRSRRG